MLISIVRSRLVFPWDSSGPYTTDFSTDPLLTRAAHDQLMGQEAREVSKEDPDDPPGTMLSAHGAYCGESLTVPSGSQSPSEGGQHGCHGGSGLGLVRPKETQFT